MKYCILMYACCNSLLSGMKEIAYKSGPEKAQVQSVLLFTDGLANQGVRTKDGILAEMMQIQNPRGKELLNRYFVGRLMIANF